MISFLSIWKHSFFVAHQDPPLLLTTLNKLATTASPFDIFLVDMTSASASVKVVWVIVVLANGSNNIYRAEVDHGSFNSSGEIVHQTFKIHIEGGKGKNRNVIAGIARVGVKMAKGKNSNVNAGISTVTAIRVINNERTPTNDDDDDENGGGIV